MFSRLLSLECVPVCVLECHILVLFSLQVKESKVTEVKINEAREHYRPAAAQASLLYFIMNDLNKIHPMYQFSLKVAGLLRHHVSSMLLWLSLRPLFKLIPSVFLPFALCFFCSLPFFYCVCVSLMWWCRTQCFSYCWPKSAERTQSEIWFAINLDLEGGCLGTSYYPTY